MTFVRTCCPVISILLLLCGCSVNLIERGEMFEKALSLLELPAGKVLHVGDSFSSDVKGAKSQGIPVLWLNRKKKQLPCVDDRPDYISSDLAGLLDMLD